MLNTNDRIIKHKVGLLNLAEELGNVSKACQVMGLSRDTFYRYKTAVDEGGVDALFEVSRRKPNLKNRIDLAAEEAVLKYVLDKPAHDQARTSNELRKLGAFVSPCGARSTWLRHNLANFKNRLKNLEAKVAAEGLILTEYQIQALERKKLETHEACGEIEPRSSWLSRLPGHLLRPHFEGCWPYLSTNVCRYLQQDRAVQTLQNEDANHGCRSTQRPCPTVFRIPRFADA